MQCPSCGAVVLAGDRFCEECGTALTNQQAKTLTLSLGCEKCGAGIEEIDAEGYCSQCGFRRLIPDAERLEVIINSHLAGVSDKGLRHHQNEDYFAIEEIANHQTQILVVCDGVSSTENPQLAAKAAAESVCQYLAKMVVKENPELAIKSAINQALNSVAQIPYTNNPHTDPPSTTIVITIVKNNLVTVGWLGDSRAYWIGANNSQKLTLDHSWLNEVVADGEMTEVEAQKSPNAHAITRWLGADVEVKDIMPSIVNFPISSSGYLLLCSDGLWNYAPNAENLAALFKQLSGKDAINISRSLVEFALNSGGHDNITVAVLGVNRHIREGM
jgi:serine/threonine protein phosphatase PrpC/DNA-directed RNA polymerase subunit RPC12/RpoP